MRKVLVTGGAGFIGHHLVNELVLQNHQVTVLDNSCNSSRHIINKLQEDQRQQRLSLYREDILNKKVVSDIVRREQFDACIHLAARVSVQESIIQPFETMDVNIIGTLNMLEACSDSGVKNFVLASSASVYGHPTVLPVPETHVTRPISPYGASKVGAEALASYFSSKLRNCLVLRFFNVYGEEQTSSYAGVITKFMERLSYKSAPVIYGDGRQTRDFIHVDDVVRAVISASEINQGNLDVMNIGTGRPTSVLDLAQALIEIFDPDEEIQPIYNDSLKGDVLHSYADIRRAKKILNFSPKTELKYGLMKQRRSYDTKLRNNNRLRK